MLLQWWSARYIFFMKIVFIAYNHLPGYHSPEQWIKRIKPFAGVMESLSRYCQVYYAGQINYAGIWSQDGVEYHFLQSSKMRSRVPFHLHQTIKKLRPDIVIVLGLHFPLEILQLRWSLGKKVKIIARHHADSPPGGIRKILLRIADHYVNAYLFTTQWHAGEWVDARIIRNRNKIHELFEASTDFTREDKEQSKKKTGMRGDHNFLWVGRLNENKDPITVLAGFEKYLSENPVARLHMIFQEDDLLPAVRSKIRKSSWLSNAVHLHGLIDYNELPAWYSAADFFISGSHREGGSYALLEAMACGCIPVVTAIPASLKTICNDKYGLSYKAGNVDELADKLSMAGKLSKVEFSANIETYFKKELSSQAIAGKLYRIVENLQAI